MDLYLVCSDARLFNRPVPLARGARYVIGRALECELYVRDSSVSRQHAELIAERGQVKVRDLASLNGTFLDDQRVAECLATPGQVLRFGRVTFLLSDDPHRTRWPTSGGEDESTVPLEPFDRRRASLLQTLSEAQRRVTALMLEGLSEKEAAKRLRLSPHTIHNHVKEVYRRLSVNSRAELLALFVDQKFNNEPN
jgi:DNA-binding CsgD family transcriptional regulator